jgi:glycosyltransferase involved in cell wall biosynthesis
MPAYPLVSIGVPTFNRARGFLPECLKSILAQSYPNLEIIVSDNCSTDDTCALVKNLEDRRIRFFSHAFNIGANNNFNFCLRQARGAYFLLLQDDDLIDPDFVQKCMEGAGSKEYGIIRTGTRIIDSKCRVRKTYPNLAGGLGTEDFFLGWFEGKTALYLCSTLFNTERLKGIGGFSSPRNLFQDVVAEARLAAKFGRLDIPEIKASFRKHEGEMTFSARVKDWCDDSLFLLDILSILSPHKKEEVRAKGLKFFSRLNYARARSVGSPIGKMKAYYTVFKKFRVPPQPAHFLRPFFELVRETPVHQGYRLLKGKLKRLPAGE